MSVRVMSWVFDHSSVEHRGDLLVLLVLADHAHDDGTSAYPSVDTIGRKARLTRRGVQLALRRLEKASAIVPTGEKGPRGTSVYRITMGELTSLRTDCAGEVSDTGGRTQRHGGAKGSSPEPSLKPSNEPSPQPPLRGGADLPPLPPEGNRKRDQARYTAELNAFTERHFPDVRPSYVGMHADMLRKRNTEPTPEALEPLLAPYRNVPDSQTGRLTAAINGPSLVDEIADAQRQERFRARASKGIDYSSAPLEVRQRMGLETPKAA